MSTFLEGFTENFRSHCNLGVVKTLCQQMKISAGLGLTSKFPFMWWHLALWAIQEYLPFHRNVPMLLTTCPYLDMQSEKTVDSQDMQTVYFSADAL